MVDCNSSFLESQDNTFTLRELAELVGINGTNWNQLSEPGFSSIPPEITTDLSSEDDAAMTSMHDSTGQNEQLIFEFAPATNPTIFHGNLKEHRKRQKKADTSLWKRISNKQKRMKGEAYSGFKLENIGNKKKQRQSTSCAAKSLGKPCSSVKCAKSSSRNCDKFTPETRQEMFSQFWKFMDWGQKRAYVGSLVDVMRTNRKTTEGATSRRSETFIYYLKLGDQKVKVCKQMFQNTLGIGRYQVAAWVKASISGMPPSPITQTEKKRKPTEESQILHKFLLDLPKVPSHYCRSSSSKLYLEPIINSKMDLFRIYKEHCDSLNQKHLSRFQLSKAVNELEIGIFMPRKDQCDTCCGHKIGQVSEQLYLEHVEKKNSAREAKIKDKCAAIEGKCHVLTMDVESVKVAPMLKASALYYKTKLMVHNFTIYNLKTHHTVCYWWDESEGDLCGSSFASCVVDYIKEYCMGDNLPIIIWSDGCTNQNRNVMMSNALLQMAISHKRVIMQKYLEKGHTQMECDSVHSAIESELKNKEIHVPQDYLEICRKARSQDPYIAKYMTHEFFDDYSKKQFQRYSSIRPGVKTGESVVVDLRALQYNPDGTILYKLNHSSEEWYNLPQKSKEISSVQYPKLHGSRLKITARKYKDLQDLKSVLPITHHDYYNNLIH